MSTPKTVISLGLTTKNGTDFTYTARAGDYFPAVVANLIKGLKDLPEGSTISFKFNDLAFKLDKSSTEAGVQAEWDAKIEAAQKAYWTPERLKTKADKERQDQNAMDGHMATLKVINFADPKDIVTWLCKFETLAMVHTKCDKVGLLKHFADNGYTPDNWPRKLGDIESSESWKLRVGHDGQVRWLIAQALDGIRSVGAPHGVIHKFAAEMLGIKSVYS